MWMQVQGWEATVIPWQSIPCPHIAIWENLDAREWFFLSSKMPCSQSMQQENVMSFTIFLVGVSVPFCSTPGQRKRKTSPAQLGALEMHCGSQSCVVRLICKLNGPGTKNHCWCDANCKKILEFNKKSHMRIFIGGSWTSPFVLANSSKPSTNKQWEWHKSAGAVCKQPHQLTVTHLLQWKWNFSFFSDGLNIHPGLILLAKHQWQMMRLSLHPLWESKPIMPNCLTKLNQAGIWHLENGQFCKAVLIFSQGLRLINVGLVAANFENDPRCSMTNHHIKKTVMTHISSQVSPNAGFSSCLFWIFISLCCCGCLLCQTTKPMHSFSMQPSPFISAPWTLTKSPTVYKKHSSFTKWW